MAARLILPGVMPRLGPYLVLLSLVLAASGGCDNSISFPETEDDRIREAVLRYQFVINGSGLSSTMVKTYFVAFVLVDSSHHVQLSYDPPGWFLQRFDGNNPPVKPVSQAVSLRGGSVYDAHTGERGIIFRVGQIRRISESEAVAEGGYFAGGLSASGNIFYLKNINGRWQVYASEDVWFS